MTATPLNHRKIFPSDRPGWCSRATQGLNWRKDSWERLYLIRCVCIYIYIHTLYYLCRYSFHGILQFLCYSGWNPLPPWPDSRSFCPNTIRVPLLWKGKLLAKPKQQLTNTLLAQDEEASALQWGLRGCQWGFPNGTHRGTWEGVGGR